MTSTRHLAAILAVDVVGYSKLMGDDEAGTLEAVKSVRDYVLEPRITEHQGRLFKSMGDGFLAEFPSVVNAVACAVTVQKAMAVRNADLPQDRRMNLRIGVHLGDVISEGDDVYGDGVNIAARIEGLAPAGGVAVSAMVHDNIGSRLDLDFEDIGEQQLKNIDRPIRTYLLNPHSAAPTKKLPDKPSIAVLPFDNMSSDKEQEHFADGLTEDLITDLSRNAGLFVISRNSTFAFKNKHMDARRIASDLGVRFLLEGSARRAGNRIRVNVQLIEAATGAHIWAERFDRELQDIFAVQDEVTAKIVRALVGRLIQTPVRNRTSSIEAYDLCVRARLLQATSAGSINGLREGQKLLYKALALDPAFAEAHRWLAFNFWAAWAHCNEPMDEYRPVSVEHAEKAVGLDPNDAGNQWVLGYILSYERRWPEVDSAFARALEIDPNNADALAALTDIAVMRGEPGVALEHIQKAMRLDPHPLGWFYWELGLAQYAARQYDAAVETLRKDATYKTGSRRILAASLAQLGLLDDARKEAKLYLADNPRFTISHWASTQPYRDDAALAHFVEGYRKAGLPE